jgi:hypothetical protein
MMMVTSSLNVKGQASWPQSFNSSHFGSTDPFCPERSGEILLIATKKGVIRTINTLLGTVDSKEVQVLEGPMETGRFPSLQVFIQGHFSFLPISDTRPRVPHLPQPRVPCGFWRTLS